MTIDALEKQIQEKRFESVYIFYGPETFLKARALKAIRAALLPEGLEGLNENVLEGVSAREILDCADTLPVMCERRLVIVRDWAPLASGKAPSCDKEIEAILDWCREPSPSSCVIFDMSEGLDEKRKGLKGVLSLNGAVRFDALTGNKLMRACAGILKECGGKKLLPDAFEELTARVGNDLTTLAGELQKLSAFVGDEKEIAAASVAEAVTPSPDFLIFEIAGQLLRGETAKATLAAQGLLRDSSMNPVRLILTLASQLRTDLIVMSGNEGLEKINPYRVKAIRKELRGVSVERLRRCYLLCTEANYAITSGRLDQRAALDDLLIRIGRCT